MSKPRITAHPGEVLRDEFMIPLGISANALSRAINVPPNRITRIISDRKPRAVTADTALRLALCFGNSPEFWLNLQVAHDLSTLLAEQGEEIERVVRPLQQRAGDIAEDATGNQSRT